MLTIEHDPSEDLVVGSGGSAKSGSSHTPVEAPNTLQARSYALFMDILSEGPIKGLSNKNSPGHGNGNAEDIFLDGTPIYDLNGRPTVSGLWFNLMQGIPHQSPLAGLASNNLNDASQTVSVNIALTHGAPGAGRIVQTIVDNDATAVLVTIEVQGLSSTNASNGDINPSSVRMQIRTRVGGSSGWNQVVDDTISGKTISNYARQYRINRPGGDGDWEIECFRATPDSTSATLVNGTLWLNYVIVNDNLFIYPNTAYAVTLLDSALFGSNLPARSFLLDGIMMSIPTNYDPIARTYAGVWDGTFRLEWTNNPAWIFYDLVTNNRYGAGGVIDPNTVDKWALYSVAQYCDEDVPDGLGGQEPRFTFNGVIDRVGDGLKVLQQVASMFDAVCFASSNTITVVQDQPNGTVRLLNQANALEAGFSYEGTALSTRPTVIRAQFIDPDDNYNPGIEVYADNLLVSQYGYRAQDIQMIGCTSRGMARRKAQNMVDMAWNSDEIVTFTGGLDQADTMPGDFVVIADPFYAGIRFGGRCLSGGNTSLLVLDAPVEIDTSSTYTVYVVYPDGQTDSRIVDFHPGQQGTAISILYVGSNAVQGSVQTLPFSQIPTPNSVWLLAKQNANPADSLAPRLFKVLTKTEKAFSSFEIKAVVYDATRRDRVELGINDVQPVFSLLTALTDIVPPPTNLAVYYNLSGIGVSTFARLFGSWTAPSDARVKGFEFSATDSLGTPNLGTSRTTSIEIDNLPADTYACSVRSITLDGRQSVWSPTVSVTITGVSDTPRAPTALTAQGGTRQISLNWVAPIQRDLSYFEIWRASTGSATPGNGATLLSTTAGTSFTDNDHANLLPLTQWWYFVRGVTTTLSLGAFAGPTTAITTRLIADDLAAGIIDTSKFAANIAPIVLWGTSINSSEVALPENPTQVNGALTIFYTNDSQLYRWNGTAFVASVPAVNITGTLSASQISTINAAQINGQLTNAQIASLASTKLTGNVVANSVVAGSILSTSLAIGSPNNVIWNSCFTITADGWAPHVDSTIPGYEFDIASTIVGSNNFTLPGIGTGAFYVPSLPREAGPEQNNASMYASWVPDSPVSVNEGTYVEAQALLGLSRCCACVQILFFDTTGAEVASSRLSSPRYAGHQGGLYEAQFSPAWVHGIAPNGAVSMMFRVNIWNDGASDLFDSTHAGANVLVFITKAALGVSVPNATSPMPWTPGGVTQITGGVLKTGTIIARNIGAQQIQAVHIAADSISTNSIQAGAVTANSINASNIFGNQGVFNSLQAGIATFGGVKADQIDANQIRAGQLASNVILSTIGQFGTITVTNAYIAHLAVGTGNIQDGAVTNSASGSNTNINNNIGSYNGSPITVEVAISFDGGAAHGRPVLILSDLQSAPATYTDSHGNSATYSQQAFVVRQNDNHQVSGLLDYPPDNIGDPLIYNLVVVNVVEGSSTNSGSGAQYSRSDLSVLTLKK